LLRSARFIDFKLGLPLQQSDSVENLCDGVVLYIIALHGLSVFVLYFFLREFEANVPEIEYLKIV
jgi:hypothetical protein